MRSAKGSAINNASMIANETPRTTSICCGGRIVGRHTALPSRKRSLAGLGGGMVAYLDNHVLHLLRVSDGHDTTAGRYDFAVLNASGLFTVRAQQAAFKPRAKISNRP